MTDTNDFAVDDDSIRPVQPDDLDDINDLLRNTFPWTAYDTTTQISRNAHEESGSIYVSVVDRNVAGFVRILPRGGFGRSAYIKGIGVRDGYQGRGIGSALLKCAESHAHRKTGRADVLLLVSDFNAGAQRFYRRHGYSKVGELSEFVESGIDEYLFRKHDNER